MISVDLAILHDGTFLRKAWVVLPCGSLLWWWGGNPRKHRGRSCSRAPRIWRHRTRTDESRPGHKGMRAEVHRPGGRRVGGPG